MSTKSLPRNSLFCIAIVWVNVSVVDVQYVNILVIKKISFMIITLVSIQIDDHDFFYMIKLLLGKLKLFKGNLLN